MTGGNPKQLQIFPHVCFAFNTRICMLVERCLVKNEMLVLQQISEDRQKHGETVDWCRELEETYKRANRLKEQLQVMIQRITLQQQLPGQKDKLQQQVG